MLGKKEEQNTLNNMMLTSCLAFGHYSLLNCKIKILVFVLEDCCEDQMKLGRVPIKIAAAYKERPVNAY